MLTREFPNCLAMTQSGKSGQLSGSDVIGDHLALRFNLSCGVMSATAQLCSPTISPKVVRYSSNPCIVHHQLILCLQLHNYAVLPSLLKLYAIFQSLHCPSSIDLLSATAQLCNPKISPEVVCDCRNPSFAQTCPNSNVSKAMVNHRSYMMCHL